MGETTDQPSLALGDDAYLAMKGAAREAFEEGRIEAEEDLNSGFKMIFEAGFKRMAWLTKQTSQVPLRVWIFLAQYADSGTGCLMISQEDLAEAVGTEIRTLRRAIRTLEENRAIITIREAGGLIYCLNPEEVWASLKTRKRVAPFNSKVLVSGKTRGILEKRLKHVVEVRAQEGHPFQWEKAERKARTVAEPESGT